MSHDRDADFAEFAQHAWPRLYRTAHLLLGEIGRAHV